MLESRKGHPSIQTWSAKASYFPKTVPVRNQLIKKLITRAKWDSYWENRVERPDGASKRGRVRGGRYGLELNKNILNAQCTVNIFYLRIIWILFENLIITSKIRIKRFSYNSIQAYSTTMDVHSFLNIGT